jgi:regulator of sigma E protease
MYGVPEARPVLAEPPAGTLAAGAGLHAGDTVRATNGEPLSTWQDLRWRVLQAALQGQKVRLETLDEKGHIGEALLDLSGFSESDVEGDVLERTGLRLYRAPLAPVLGKLVPGGAGDRAGLKEGDRILSAGGKALDTWEALVNVVRASPKVPLHLEVARAGRNFPVEVVPDAVANAEVTIGRIGAAPFVPPGQVDRIVVRIQYGLFESLGKGLGKTVDISVFSLKMLGKMLVGQVSWRHLSGPVTIADFAGQSAQLGWMSYVTFLALISISLGVLNLLPVPLLDGGHLMYYVIEIIKGKPVSERAMELGQRVGLALLLVMMAFAFYNDLNRLLTG